MKKPNHDILFIDIETAPNIGFFWTCGHNQTITHEQIIVERRIISISYCGWDDRDKPKVIHWGLNEQNDTKALKTISEIINNAQIVIGQNSDAFDIPWIQGRLAKLKLKPIPNKTVLTTLDTFKMAKNSLYLNSYKLDYMLKFFGFPPKIPMHYSDWYDIIIYKNKTKFKKMLRYNKHDVDSTRKLFKRMLPYVQVPPAFGVILGQKSRDCCPECGSEERGIHAKAKVNRSGLMYMVYKCKKCQRHYRDYMNVNMRVKTDNLKSIMKKEKLCPPK